MTCVLLPVLAFVFGYQILFVLNREAALAIGFDPGPLVDRVTDMVRSVLGVGVIAIAVWLARRGRLGMSVVLGCTGVMLLALSMRLLTGYSWALWIDLDSINLVATGVVLVALIWHLLRRSLTRQRAIALAGLLVLSALFSYRDFVSDPVGALLGYSGVALVLFGLVWDFLTGSDWANGGSRRFPRPVRVLLAAHLHPAHRHHPRVRVAGPLRQQLRRPRRLRRAGRSRAGHRAARCGLYGGAADRPE